MDLIIKITENDDEKRKCFNVRNKVFVKELGFIEKENCSDSEETDIYDTLPTTTHFIAINNNKGVGAARLIGPDEKMVSGKKKNIFGLPIEELFDLSEYKKHNITPYEISRSSVIRHKRASRIILDIWKISILYGKMKKITTFCSCAGTETDCLEDSKVIYTLLKLKNCFHPDIHTEPSTGSITNSMPRHRLYDKKIVEEILEKDTLNKKSMESYELKGIKLPPTLNYFIKIGAKFTGPPVIFTKFIMYTIPMILDINNTNEPFKTFFERESEHIKL